MKRLFIPCVIIVFFTHTAISQTNQYNSRNQAFYYSKNNSSFLPKTVTFFEWQEYDWITYPDTLHYDYNADGKLASVLRAEYLDTYESLYRYTKEVYEYESDLLNRVYYLRWIPVLELWDTSYFYQYRYDSRNNQTKFEAYYPNQFSKIYELVYADSIRYSYNGNQVTERYSYSLHMPTNTYMPGYREKYTYDSLGVLVEEITDSYYLTDYRPWKKLVIFKYHKWEGLNNDANLVDSLQIWIADSLGYYLYGYQKNNIYFKRNRTDRIDYIFQDSLWKILSWDKIVHTYSVDDFKPVKRIYTELKKGVFVNTYKMEFKDYVLAGLSDNTNSKFVKVYPVPAKDMVTVVLEEDQNADFILYDITGKIVITTPMDNGKVNIQRDNLKSGLYHFRIVSENNKIYTGKLIFE